MDLVIDTTVSHKNLEGTLVAPCVVPGVNAKPVVKTVFSAPTDNLDSVTTFSSTSQVLINTRRVSEEVFIDCESSGNCTVGHDFHLDIVDTSYSIAGCTVDFVTSVVDSSVALASALTNRGNSLNSVTSGKVRDCNVMSTLWHSVVEAVLT